MSKCYVDAMRDPKFSTEFDRFCCDIKTDFRIPNLVVAVVLLMPRLVMICGHGSVRRCCGRHRVTGGRRRGTDPGCSAVEL